MSMTGSDKPVLRFSSYFNVNPDEIDRYGAVDISLAYDLPLFIDPFLLFGSSDPEYREIHEEIIRYLRFLKSVSQSNPAIQRGMLDAWFRFPEVRQTWLGFSESGNNGRGLGLNFAHDLSKGLTTVFSDFGNEEILESPHMEKLSLLGTNIGKDKISDFTTRFALPYLLKYTEEFAKEYISPSLLGEFNIRNVRFDYEKEMWLNEKHTLPSHRGDYVLLTPKDILTKSDTFINRTDMVNNATQFATSIGNAALRFQFERFLQKVLNDDKAKKKEKNEAIAKYICKHPELSNYYIRFKENRKEQAKINSKIEVDEVRAVFNDAANDVATLLDGNTDFYSIRPSSFEEAKKRVLYLKNAIENQDVYKVLWRSESEPVNETEAQLLFKLVWYGSSYDLNREVNNGRGPVDYTVSKGAINKSIIEFKLATNTHLKQGLEKQVPIYKTANKTDYGITVIIFFTERQQKKVEKILNELGLSDNEQIVIIDARRDNKVSASKA